MGELPQQQGWSPNDTHSPYYVWHLLREEEWRVIVKAYPYSVRALIQLHDETRWSEEARTSTQEQANDLMQGLAHLYQTKEWWIGWVVMECQCLSNQVYEKPICWYPTQEHVLAVLRQAKLLKTSL